MLTDRGTIQSNMTTIPLPRTTFVAPDVNCLNLTSSGCVSQRYQRFIARYHPLLEPHHLPTCFFTTLERLFRRYVATLQDAHDLPNQHRRLKLRMLAAALVAAQIHSLPLTLHDMLWKTGSFRCRIQDNHRFICRCETRDGRSVPKFAESLEAQRRLLNRIASPFDQVDVQELVTMVQRMHRTNPKLAARSHRMLLLAAVRAVSSSLFIHVLYERARTLLMSETRGNPKAKKKCDVMVNMLVRRLNISTSPSSVIKK